MSALPPKADIPQRDRHVRFVPKADICGAANNALFDHLVGAGEQRRRHGYAEYPGGLVVDYQFQFRRLYHRKVLRLRTLENTADIDAGLKMRVRNV